VSAMKKVLVSFLVLLNACSGIKSEDLPKHCGLDYTWRPTEVTEPLLQSLLEVRDDEGTVEEILNEVQRDYEQSWFMGVEGQLAVCRYQPKRRCSLRSYAKFSTSYALEEKAFVICWQH
jgi:hypothetical protein